MAYRKTVAEYSRDGRRVQVDEVETDPEFGASFEVWEVGEDAGKQWESCHTEGTEPFDHRPTETEVWALVEEEGRLLSPTLRLPVEEDEPALESGDGRIFDGRCGDPSCSECGPKYTQANVPGYQPA